MSDLSHITSCLDVTSDDLNAARASRSAARALVERMAHVARPNQGAAKILHVIATIAECDWFEGGLRVEIGGDPDMCVLDVLGELAVGFSERVFPSIVVGVPLDEIRRAVHLQPRFILPLKLKHDRPSRLVFSAEAESRFSTMPPPEIKVGDEAVTWGRRTRPPALAPASPRGKQPPVAHGKQPPPPPPEKQPAAPPKSKVPPKPAPTAPVRPAVPRPAPRPAPSPKPEPKNKG
jgi:hypothetical protein